MTSNDMALERLVSVYDAQEKMREQQRRLDAFLIELVGIVDTLHELERHCAEVEGEGTPSLARKSVEVARRRLLAALRRQQVEPMSCQGQPFDLDRHEALEVKEVPGGSDDVVLEEIIAGYLVADRVLRQAQVVISRAAPVPETPSKRAKRRQRARKRSHTRKEKTVS